MSKQQKTLPDAPAVLKMELMHMPFEMFQEVFKHIRDWALLHRVCNLLRAHIKRCMDTPTGSTLKAHYQLAANRFNQAPRLLKPAALAEIQLYCRLYQLESLTVRDVVPAEQFYTFGEMLAQNAVHLTFLDLSNTQFVIAGLQPLTRLTGLRHLNLSGNTCLRNAQQQLALPANLLSLAINNCGLRGMGRWPPQVTRLRRLELSGNTFQGEDGGFVSQQMRSFPLLQTLRLRNASLSALPLAAILDQVSTTLTRLDVGYNIVGAWTTPYTRAPVYTALARLTALTELNLAGCFLAQPPELATALSAMSALKVLDVTPAHYTERQDPLSDPLSAEAAAFLAAFEARGVRVIRSLGATA